MLYINVTFTIYLIIFKYDCPHLYDISITYVPRLGQTKCSGLFIIIQNRRHIR